MPVAVKAWVAPRATLVCKGVTVMDVSTAGRTINMPELFESSLLTPLGICNADIVAVPVEMAVAVPAVAVWLLTLATAGRELFHITVRVILMVDPSL